MELTRKEREQLKSIKKLLLQLARDVDALAEVPTSNRLRMVTEDVNGIYHAVFKLYIKFDYDGKRKVEEVEADLVVDPIVTPMRQRLALPMQRNGGK
jgi:hypothetical protein